MKDGAVWLLGFLPESTLEVLLGGGDKEAEMAGCARQSMGEESDIRGRAPDTSLGALCVCWSLSHVQTLCDPMDYSLPESSVHGILQARILVWVAISFSRGSSNPGIKPRCPALQADSLSPEPPGSPVFAWICILCFVCVCVCARMLVWWVFFLAVPTAFRILVPWPPM